MTRTFLLAGLMATIGATSAFAEHDHFNRATLGMRWVVPFGSEFIVNNQMQGATGSLGYDAQAADATTVGAVVSLGSTDLEYGALAAGDVAGGTNAFVKIQAQTSDGKFSNAAFYTGDNGGGDFFTLRSEVPSPATLTLSFCGTVAKLKITSSAGSQSYKYDYGTTFTTGQGGLGTYGSVSLDNFRGKAGGCANDAGGIWIKKGSGARAVDKSLSK